VNFLPQSFSIAARRLWLSTAPRGYEARSIIF